MCPNVDTPWKETGTNPSRTKAFGRPRSLDAARAVIHRHT
jgi:hypothetical protein